MDYHSADWGFRVPPDLECLLDQGLLEYSQWDDGAVQILSRKFMDDTILHLCIDHEDSTERIVDGPRYTVHMEYPDGSYGDLVASESEMDAAKEVLKEIIKHVRPW